MMIEDKGHQINFYYPSQTTLFRTTLILLAITPDDHLCSEAGGFSEHDIKLHNLDEEQGQPYHLLVFNPRHDHLSTIGK